MLAFDPPATRDWDFPRSVAGVALLVTEGRAAGVPVEGMLAGSGLSADDLADHRREVTAAQELRVVRNLLRAAPATAGMRVGARYHASTFGALGFALMSSRTLGDAANLALRFIDLSFTFTIPAAGLDGTTVVVGFDDRALPDDVRRFLVERDLAAIWTVLRELGGGLPRLGAVRLGFPPADPEPCRAVLGLEPEFGCARTELRFDADWLDLPLPQANPHSLALSEALCRDLVSRRRRRSGIAEHARVMIAQRVADGAPMPEVAAALGLSERSLRRRLAEADTSYRALLDEVRHALAEELLAAGLLVGDVALRLGYAEATSFILAHRRWTGRTPRSAVGRPPDGSRDLGRKSRL